jgi:SAM-dependent methyltransferase
MIGFGVLCFAEHSLLRSIGISSLLGIFYSLAGSFLLLPPLLSRYFAESSRKVPGDRGLFPRVCRRYHTLEAYPLMFARFKLRYDPMFADLPRMLAARQDIRVIVDIGCGYGVPACWCMENFAEARIAAIEPDPERVRVAALALGARGEVTQGWAPVMPEVADGSADVVLLLDMLHYVDDATVEVLLRRSFRMLAFGGILVMRCTVSPGGGRSWAWRLEEARIRLSGHRPWFRDPDQLAGLLEAAGFTVVVNEVTANPELAWLVGRVDKGAASGEGVSHTIVHSR